METTGTGINCGYKTSPSDFPVPVVMRGGQTTQSRRRVFALVLLLAIQSFALFVTSTAFVLSSCPSPFLRSSIAAHRTQLLPRFRTPMTTTMMGRTIDSALRFVFNYPKFMDELPGPYGVSSLVRTRLPNSVATTISYPAEPASPTLPFASHQPGQSYWSQDQVDGLVDYTQQTKLAPVLSTLRRAWHPSSPVGRAPLSPPDGQGWPVIVFSHGLAGNADMYTDLCRCISSYGYIVISMEHEDGSGSHAASKDGEMIRYKRPDSTPYSREKVTRFRAPFLQQRVDETEQVLLQLVHAQANPGEISTSSGSGEEETRALGAVLGVSDTTCVSLVGHSFGAASSLLAAQQLQAKQRRFTLAALLDPWAFCVPDAALRAAASAALGGAGSADQNAAPLLSIISEAWLDSKERFAIDTLLRSAHSAGRLRGSYFAADSVHQSFSDTVCWLPRWIAGRSGMLGPKEARGSTQRSVAEAIHKQIQAERKRSGAGALGAVGDLPEQLQPYDAWRSGGEGEEKVLAAMSESAQN